jgi:hypothetical protein
VRRVRLLAAASVALFLIATRVLYPEEQARAFVQYLFVITLGYGHLLGALAFSLRRMAARVPAGVPSALFTGLLACSAATLFSLYCLLATAHGAFFVALLAVSTWHVVENDLALRMDAGGLALHAGVSRRLASHLAGVAVTALLLALAAASLLAPGFARRFSFGDVFSAVTLYHLASFLLVFGERVRSGPRSARRAIASRLAWVHLPPALLCVALLAVPDARFGTVREIVFSPSVYLFWSVLHVLQTLVLRGLEAPPARHAVPGA